MTKNSVISGAMAVAMFAGTFAPLSAFAETGYGGGGGGGGGGGNGPIVGTFGGFSFGGGQVLGASTTTLPTLPTSCTALLTTYMRRGAQNNAAEVRKLQQFLNTELSLQIPVTGVFGPLTEAGVKRFQTKYASDVLTPWGLTGPTGYVYKTTQRWINLVHCKTLNIPMPELN